MTPSATHLLLVPTMTEVEWRIKPLLSEWAEVASFDAPGVGEAPPAEPGADAVVERGLAELERRGWERCVIVGDEVGAALAARIAARRPAAVRALVMGHPALSFTTGGNRPTINGEVLDALMALSRTEYRSFVRALAQLTQDAYDEELADLYMERVSQDLVQAYMADFFGRAGQIDLLTILRGLDAPLLLVEHAGCLMWTREGFEDAIAALPDAVRTSVELKPSVNPAFATLLRDFCENLPAE